MKKFFLLAPLAVAFACGEKAEDTSADETTDETADETADDGSADS